MKKGLYHKNRIRHQEAKRDIIAQNKVEPPDLGKLELIEAVFLDDIHNYKETTFQDTETGLIWYHNSETDTWTYSKPKSSVKAVL